MASKKDPLKMHPSDIFKVMDEAFDGEDWISWEAEVTVKALDPNLSDRAKDKVLAVQATAANSNLVVSDSVAFEKVVMAFNNNVCVMDQHQAPYLEEVFYAIREIRKIISLVHKEDDYSFRGDVPQYIAGVAKYYDWFMLPKPLEFAQESLDYLNGSTENTKKRKEMQTVIDAVAKASKALSTASYEEISENKDITKLKKSGVGGSLLSRVIAAHLYDPTIVA